MLFTKYFKYELTFSIQVVTMAGNLAFFVGLLAFSAGLEINSRECQPSGKTLNCRWRGKGNYVVSTPLYQEILTMNYMSIAASLIVPPHMKGSLMKIEIRDGDISCSAIIAPHTILVYITKQRCVSKLCMNL